MPGPGRKKRCEVMTGGQPAETVCAGCGVSEAEPHDADCAELAKDPARRATVVEREIKPTRCFMPAAWRVRRPRGRKAVASCMLHLSFAVRDLGGKATVERW